MGVLLTTLGAPAAGARVIERERYSGTESGTQTIRGKRYHGEATFSGVFTLKTHGDRPTPYLSDNYRFRIVLTNRQGDGFIIEGNGLYKDVRIEHVRGTIYRFIAQEAGQPFTIRALDGTVVLRDRGLLRYTFLVDTKGDSDLSNDRFIDESFRVLKDAGKHPGSYFDQEQYCAAIEEAIRL